MRACRDLRDFSSYTGSRYRDLGYGCVVHFEGRRAADCYRSGSLEEGHLPSSLEVLVNTTGGIWHDYGSDDFEIDWPVCAVDENSAVLSLEQAGCDVGDVHVHGYVSHVHAVCPVDSLDDVLNEVRRYGS